MRRTSLRTIVYKTIGSGAAALSMCLNDLSITLSQHDKHMCEIEAVDALRGLSEETNGEGEDGAGSMDSEQNTGIELVPGVKDGDGGGVGGCDDMSGDAKDDTGTRRSSKRARSGYHSTVFVVC